MPSLRLESRSRTLCIPSRLLPKLLRLKNSTRLHCRQIPYTVMSESNAFPGSHAGHGERHAGGGAAPFNRIVEEDENVTSPTTSTFHRTDVSRQRAHIHHVLSPFQSGDGVGTFGEFGAFGPNPFGGRGEQEHGTFRPAAGPSDSGFPNHYALGRRTSVSAESLNPTSSDSDSWTPPYHPKPPEQLDRLKTAVAGNFLFSHLEEDQFKTVLNALVEKPVPAKDIKVITQGDAGDYFYIVEQGHFDVFIHPSGSAQPGHNGMGSKVNEIGPGGSFGELALMYNAPRAATVVSTEPSTVWALDRVTFRRILMDSAFKRRRMYEAFLEEVPLLSSLKPYERSKIADALDTIKHPAGHTIIEEGDPGDAFYLLESGEAAAYKRGIDGAVKHYRRGDYFGELALLDDKPRQASVIAKTDVKVAQLGRDGFKRLLGPVEDIMRRTEYGVPEGQPKLEASE
ncbi:cAMP-dependent protein kinase regulatory subunit [Coccidioides immitis RS]|uniref:cAMP-dependent protein kinase regulatory subunit n=4 Tax=Coccidioides immitis TaxID=5501 RepID=A0A0D8JZ89_COCIM|nr:cAMP-dependent protein kinase regulatory subunit [Coccidioides immitis RS]KJF61583.1 cAMP-dependent protein kinase regulatory subunit [Coccidioides immitis RS]KMP08214.1 cAMP-dependent protein kinase regulatory subunit [Coccidioides immitis RMSCC 2394]KMU79507.1 cAMP-dependent protein kinase regulatory subunit [Coccidioides immitis RMSCC 3703]